MVQTAYPHRSGPGRPRSPEAGPGILAAAFELVAEFGYAAVTVEAIARRAGVSKATIYRRWPSKAQLVVDALAQSPPLRSRPRGDLASDLGALLREFLRLAESTPLGGALFALAAESAHDAELETAFAPLLRARTRPFVEAIGRAIERGELPAHTDVDFAVEVALGPVLIRLLLGRGPVGPRFVRDVVRTAITGLAAAGRRTGAPSGRHGRSPA